MTGTSARVAATHAPALKGRTSSSTKVVPSGKRQIVSCAARRATIASMARVQQMWTLAQAVFYGLSLGSVLLLAAAGLAITFGVMGVINMAHGEMVMLGAYTSFVVQHT